MGLSRWVWGVALCGAASLSLAAAQEPSSSAKAESPWRYVLVISRHGAQWIELDANGEQAGEPQPVTIERALGDALLGLSPAEHHLFVYDGAGALVLDETLEIQPDSGGALPLEVRLASIQIPDGRRDPRILTWNGSRLVPTEEALPPSQNVAPLVPCTPGEPCSDGKICTDDDTCNAQGVCRGTPRSCHDGNRCTADSCLEILGGCLHLPVLPAGSCDDGDPCTGSDRRSCVGDECIPGPNVCPTIATLNGGETVMAGAQQLLEWTPVEAATHYKVKLSLDGGASWRLVTDTASVSYSWLVPDVRRVHSHCLLKVIAMNRNYRLGTDRSDAVFTIAPPAGAATSSDAAFRIVPPAAP